MTACMLEWDVEQQRCRRGTTKDSYYQWLGAAREQQLILHDASLPEAC